MLARTFAGECDCVENQNIRDSPSDGAPSEVVLATLRLDDDGDDDDDFFMYDPT